MKRSYEIKTVSSMEKIFPEQKTVTAAELTQVSALKGECVSFQIALKIEPDGGWRQAADCLAKAEGDCAAWTDIRRVDLAPSLFAAYADADDQYLRKTPGLYPDILQESQELRCTDDAYRCFWVSVWIPETAAAGEYAVKVSLWEKEIGNHSTGQQEKIAEISVSLLVIDAVLPRQTLIRTEWFHADCLADYYQVPVRSERWWEIVENFVSAAAKHGINMILTPIFTQPLDTQVGGERTTVQLVDIEKDETGYHFDFAALKRWVRLCQKAGIVYFEMAHLFTQWGAAFTPKIMGKVNGVEQKMFGWHVSAQDPSYAEFLQAFLPALTEKLQEWGIAAQTVFHVSDEPSEEQLESYQASKALVEDLLEGFPIMDALSEVEFYKRGIIRHPIPANDAIEPFLEAGVENLWTYYCCAQRKDVSNRFFSMPGARTRILGAQLYRHHIAGFLQWGYNFYNTQHSKAHINPYEVTDAGNAFPSGDAFLVYPGADGRPVGSVRLMLMLEAMQDMRALEKLEELCGREETEKLLMEGIAELSFSVYPRDAQWLLDLRRRVNERIAGQEAS